VVPPSLRRCANNRTNTAHLPADACGGWRQGIALDEIGKQRRSIRHVSVAREVIDIDDQWPVRALYDVQSIQPKAEQPAAAACDLAHFLADGARPAPPVPRARPDP